MKIKVGIVSSLTAIFLCQIILLQTSCYAADNLDNQFINQEGANVFLTFCAGCHGIQGFAAYSGAPSFSMGDRLNKSDDELLQSVLNGKGAMPPWEDKLPENMLVDAIAYLRIMHARLGAGLDPLNSELPERMYTFKPEGENDELWWYHEMIYN